MFKQNDKGLLIAEGGFEFCERTEVLDEVVANYEENRKRMKQKSNRYRINLKNYIKEVMDGRECFKYNFEDSKEIEKIIECIENDMGEPFMRLPERSSKYSAGYDFFSPCSFVLNPGENLIIQTGIKVKLPPFVFLALYPRSGSGCKFKIRLRNTVGIIDSDYYNNSKNEGNIIIQISHEDDSGIWVVNQGDKFVQGILTPYFVFSVDNVDATREGGFGSSDRR